MSQQAEGVLAAQELLDRLVRSKVIVSKDGYSCDGTDLLAFPNSDDSPTTNLNDIINTEAKAADISTVSSKTVLVKNADGTFVTPIQAPASSSTNPMDLFGFRLREIGNFSYTPPAIVSSDWDGSQQPKMIDRTFTTDPAILTVDNNETKQTTFNYTTAVSRNILVKIQANITAGTPTLSYAIRGNNTGFGSFTDIETGTLTDGVILQTTNTASFQFYQIEIKALSTGTIGADFLIYEISDISTSPTVSASDWIVAEQNKMIDGNLTTFGTLAVSPTGGLWNKTVFNFASVATRIILSKFRQISTVSDLQSRTMKSDDNIAFTNINLTPTKRLEWNADAGVDGLTVDNDNFIYSADSGTDTVDKYNSAGVLQTTWTSTETGLTGIANDSSNNIYVIGTALDGVTKTTNTGTPITTWTTGDTIPNSITIDTNNDVYVHGATGDTIFKTNNVGTAITSWSVDVSVQHIASDSANNIYTISSGTDLIKKYSSTGTFITSWTTTEVGTPANYGGLAIDSNDLVYLANDEDGTPVSLIGVYTNTGTFVTSWTGQDVGIEAMAIGKNTDDDVYVWTDTGEDIEKWSFNDLMTTNTIVENIQDITSQYVRLELYSSDIAAYTATKDIFEVVSNSSTPVITSTDWASTNLMIDNTLSTFNTLSVTDTPTITRTSIVNFGTILVRTPTVKLRFDTISGAPTNSFDLQVSNDNVTYASIATGTPLTGVFTTATAAAQGFQYMKIIMGSTGGGVAFENNLSIFEMYDSAVLNGLDSSTVIIGGSTTADTTVNQTDPITLQISDAGTILHPPRYFPIEQAKFLTATVSILRTGQTISVDRVMTWQRNFAPP